MKTYRCDSSDCQEVSCAHVTWVEKRHSIEEKRLCREHAAICLNEYHAQPSGIGRLGTFDEIVEFDIELLVLYEDEEHASSNSPGQLVLREVHGTRTFEFMIGWAEAWAIHWYLKHTPSKRPLTHEAWLTTIAALGGTLKQLTLHDVNPTDNITYAKCEVVTNHNQLHTIDIRPSDAIVLAIVCNFPILVSERVLRHWRR